MAFLARISLRWPGATIAITLLVSAALCAGALRLTVDAGFRAYVGPDHPAVRELDGFLARFGGGLPAAAVWSCEGEAPCRSVFDPAALRMAHTVATYLEPVDGVLAVESPATSSLLVPGHDGFAVRRLVEGGEVSRDRALLAERALADPLWTDRLVSPDGRVGAILIELASSGSDVNVRVMNALEEALAPFREAGFEFHLVGDPVEFVVAGRDLQEDTFRLVPAIVALIGLIVFALFRSAYVAFACLVTVGVAVGWSFGVMGWLGWPQTAVTQALAPFILVVGVCNAVHLLSRCAAEGGADRGARIRAAAADVGPACVVASLTTAAGFLSFATSGAVSFVRFGVIAAVGVTGALVLTFTLLPALLRAAPLPAPPCTGGWRTALRQIVRVSEEHTGWILMAAAVVAILCGFGMTRLRVEVDVEHLFGEQSDVVRWIRFVEERLRESSTLEVELQLPEGAVVRDPAVLARVDRAAAALSAVDGLGAADSLLQPLSRLNRLLHDDDPAFERPGASAQANAELLFLAELQDPRYLGRWVGFDRRALRLSVPVAAESHSTSERLLANARDALTRELPESWSFALTGPLSASYHMVEEVQRTQLRSFATATLVVSVLIAIFLRSAWWGLLATLPNLLPVIVCLGAMGLWGIYLDIGTAMVAAVVLGIAVDDTVHLLSQYRRRIDAGVPPTAAIHESVVHVGRAVVTTSFALAAGFFVLTLSSWASVASFGFLSGISILAALVADLVVLPALLLAVSRGHIRARALEPMS
ncbi:MAG: MMPL family transporter [Proteobacteria bacterium]|nr:MMPL family transporter [Pseudomonadota bacterium]